jgi:sigma-B regulation protein RsbU (phosphoserine phosphatase)
LPDRIYVKDSEGRYILDNAAHMRNLGLEKPEDVIGKTVFDFFPPEVASKFDADDHTIMKTGAPLLDREERTVDTAGNTRWLSTTKVPYRDSAGSIAGIVCTSSDITQRKHQEEQLARYAEELHQKNTQMEEDLNMARELQQAFLPDQYFTFPKESAPAESALWFCYHYLPATVIGGDFFDVLALSDTEVGIFIGDVMGHGVRPALITSILRGLVQELRPVATDPGKFMCEINRGLSAILRQTRIPIFASGFYLVANTSTGEIRFANAGHPSPLHLRPATGEVEPLRTGLRPGAALGVFEDAVYATAQRKVRPDDRVLLFTDGLFEVEGPDADYYDEKRLLEAIRKRMNLPLAKLFEDLLDEIREFSTTKHFDDDMCLVGMEARRIAK